MGLIEMNVSEKTATQSFHTSRIELSESALRKNIRFLKKIVGNDRIFSSVIKGNAYGHDISVFVPLAVKCGIKHFSVYSPSEALEASKCIPDDCHIMIMGDLNKDVIEWAVRHDVSFFIFSLDWLDEALNAAKKLDKKALIHLELETGLNRTGLYDHYLEQAANTMLENPEFLHPAGVCTHYAGAESISNFVRIKGQIELFNKLVEELESKGLKFDCRHTACSAAALSYPETRMDMVRIGIAHYGFWPSRETQMHYYQGNGEAEKNSHRRDPLHRVLSWKSRIMNIKEVKPGDFVGYGNAYMTIRRQKVACVPVGYYHGFSRNLSNRGYVLVRGRRALVIGWVNMNMLMIDVTDFKNVELGDEVVIIGTQKKQTITVGSFSDMTRFLNYEILVKLSENIPRIVVK